MVSFTGDQTKASLSLTFFYAFFCTHLICEDSQKSNAAESNEKGRFRCLFFCVISMSLWYFGSQWDPSGGRQEGRMCLLAKIHDQREKKKKNLHNWSANKTQKRQHTTCLCFEGQKQYCCQRLQISSLTVRRHLALKKKNGEKKKNTPDDEKDGKVCVELAAKDSLISNSVPFIIYWEMQKLANESLERSVYPLPYFIWQPHKNAIRQSLRD